MIEEILGILRLYLDKEKSITIMNRFEVHVEKEGIVIIDTQTDEKLNAFYDTIPFTLEELGQSLYFTRLKLNKESSRVMYDHSKFVDGNNYIVKSAYLSGTILCKYSYNGKQGTLCYIPIVGVLLSIDEINLQDLSAMLYKRIGTDDSVATVNEVTAATFLYCLSGTTPCVKLPRARRRAFLNMYGIEYRDLCTDSVMPTPYPHRYHNEIMLVTRAEVTPVGNLKIDSSIMYDCGTFLVYAVDNMFFAHIPSEQSIVTLGNKATLVLETLKSKDKSNRDIDRERLQKYLESTDPATAATKIIDRLYLNKE